MSSQSRQRSDPSAGSAAAAHPAALSSVVLAVHDLQPSVGFYRDLLGMEVTVTDAGAALLVSSDGFQLYLREVGERAEHASGSVGVHAVIWTAHDADDLQRREHWLQARDAHVQSWNGEDYAMVEGRDPSGLPVLLVHPGPSQATRHDILSRLYAL